MSSGHISLPANKPEDLFYRGTKILSQDIINLKKLLIKLESDQFDFEITLDKPSSYPINKISNLIYIAAGLMFGVFFSFVIIFFKSVLKNN